MTAKPPISAEVVVTDYGDVVLSPMVVAYLDQVAPRRHSKKRHRGKKYEAEMRKAARVEAAVMVCAEIQFLAGGRLETF